VTNKQLDRRVLLLARAVSKLERRTFALADDSLYPRRENLRYAGGKLLDALEALVDCTSDTDLGTEVARLIGGLERTGGN
jgi:hypothetical protein